MLNLTNITVSFGGRDLYKNISFQINPKDKIGVVGKNGAGKSTMLKLITGEQKPNSGTINTTNSLSIGYLPQEINVNSNEEILNEVLMANKQLLSINHRLDEINLEITTRTDYESESYLKLLTELSDLNEQLSLLDGDNQLKDAELILKGLGFEQNELTHGINTLKVSQEFDITLNKAWDFFSNPKNLSEITPSNMGFNITSEIPNQMYVGQIVTYRVAPILGIKLNWVTEITHINNKMFFVDEQRFGPYIMWHHEHLFLQKGDKVEMTDKVSFKVPFGILGRIMTPIFVIPQLKKIFNYRYKLLEQKFNNG